MSSGHPLLLLAQVPISNGATPLEEERSEDEEGEEFEFDDGNEDPTAIKEKVSTPISNLNKNSLPMINTNDLEKLRMNGTPSSSQEGQIMQENANNADIVLQESPEERSISSKLGTTVKEENYKRPNGLHKGDDACVFVDTPLQVWALSLEQNVSMPESLKGEIE